MSLIPAPTRPGPVLYTDAQMIKTLKRLAQGQTTLSRTMFTHRRAGTDPSAALYESRFGTWNNALRHAGLTPIEQDIQLQGTTTKWHYGQLINALQHFMAETGTTSCNAYEAWRQHPTNTKRALPPAATIRYRLGSWSRAISLSNTD